MSEQLPDHLSTRHLEFGSTDPFLPGITLYIPNLYGVSASFNAALFQYLAADDAVRQYALTQSFFASNADRWERFFFLCLTTAAGHEMRHFHEFYGSPFGARILSGLIANSLTSAFVIPVLQQEQTIAVPLASWAKLSEPVHALYERQTRSKKLSRRPPPQVTEVASITAARIGQLKTLYQQTSISSRFGFGTRHLMETSAMSVQRRVISDLFGTEMLSSFDETFGLYDEKKEYDRLSSIWGWVGGNAVSDPTVRNAVIFFALCGNWWDDPGGRLNHPADRLLEVSLIALRDKRNPDASGVLGFLADCADEMGAPPLEECLRQSAARFDAFVSDMKARVTEVFDALGLKKSLERYLTFMGEVAASHRHMAEAIAADPLSFFDPGLYFKRAHEWLAAPRWYRNDTYFFSPGNPAINLKTGFGEGDWLVPGFVTVRDDENIYAPLLLSKYTTAGTQVLSPESAYHFGIDNYINNVLWANGFPDPRDEKYAFLFLQNRMPDKEWIHLRF